MADDFIRRSEAMNKINDIAAEFLKDHTIQCDIAAGVAVEIKNDVIKTLPAADVVEVVHGEWVITHDFDDNYEAMRPLGRVVRCSVCGYPTGHIKTNFCPECGAKMDGERRSE